MEKIEIEKEKLQKLLDSFYAVCCYCDELNIYEWSEADKDMQEMKNFVTKNFGRKIK